MQGLAE
jgi:hypothetical protein